MKHEIGIVQPSCLVEDWPDKYDVFSWLEYVVTVPNPIFLVTTRKANGAANANLHSWGLLIGEAGPLFVAAGAARQHAYLRQHPARGRVVRQLSLGQAPPTVL